MKLASGDACDNDRPNHDKGDDLVKGQDERGSKAAPAPKAAPTPKAANRRAAPEVIEKRRSARQFNQLLQGDSSGSIRDGRTEKRRQRLLRELSEGVARGGKRELSPVDVLSRVQALLDLGEPLASIKKARPPKRPVAVTAELVETVRRLHLAYDFSPDAYAFVGVDEDALRRAGLRKEAAKPLASARGGAPPKPSVVGAATRPRGEKRRGVA